MVFKMADLFCGPGGIAKGASMASIEEAPEFKIEHAWATDIDPDACATYAMNIPGASESSVFCADIRSFPIESQPDIDALSFGFPCNDYSVVGEQKGMLGKYGPLYQYGVEALRHFQPKWFFAENVGGIRSANDGKALEKILTELRDAGYAITPHLYKFEEYGLPQARHRVIIIGIRDDLASDVQFQVPSTAPYAGEDNSVEAALSGIPAEAMNQEATKQSPLVVERLQHIRPGQNAFTADLPEHLQLNIRGAKISQIYRRLDPKKPAYTVTGSGGGGTHMYHWEEPRALTNRERARIQTFPDDFVFVGSKESVRKQIGMAVPVRGAQIIFEAVLRTFAGIPYATDEVNMGQMSMPGLSICSA